MKVRLTELQYNKIFLLKESNDILTNYEQTVSDVSAKVDILFSKVTFISIAEIPKHVGELKQHKNQLGSYVDILKAGYDKMTYFFNHQISQEEFDTKWSSIDIKVDNLYYSVDAKIDSLSDMIDTLISLNDSEAFKLFEHVKPVNI